MIKQKLKKAAAFAVLFCFTSLTGAQPLYAIPANTQLPTVDNSFTPIGGVNIPGINEIQNNTMNITQTDITSVIKWENFSIGADATVNFTGPKDGFNSLNFVNSGAVSEIYGQLNALGGNIFIANPAGVSIGNSAQINVGSLYVTNREIDERALLNTLTGTSGTDDIRAFIAKQNAQGTAELMSLGSIISTNNKVTFDGDRIVIDADRLYTKSDGTKMMNVETNAITGLTVHTSDADKLILGYSAYDGSTYANKDKTFTLNVNSTANGAKSNSAQGYMWVENAEQLQAMNTNLNGWYALRNSIDANATANFTSIGTAYNSAFSGRLDGLDYSIFGLNISVAGNGPAGLFGYTNGAHIRNFTLNSGSVSGNTLVGSAVGHARGGVIENITNTLTVSGNRQVGGIVGYTDNVAMSNLINTGTVTGDISGNSIGGIVGYMYGGALGGTTYNLGGVSGGHDVGGIVGYAYGATIGGGEFRIYNQLNVTGQYDAGGIVGNLENGTVTNTANYGSVTANGWTEDTYRYHTAETDKNSANLNGAELSDGVASINVNAANAGGIAGKSNGGTITNVTNEGSVTAGQGTLDGGAKYYTAGNVGGIVGRAENTAITKAENKENTVAGAHNAGGIAGYLTGSSSIDGGVNNGGDITATGARKYGDIGFATEYVRSDAGANEKFIVGNIGGIAGYVEGGNAKVSSSGNRGTVHSAYIDGDVVPDTAKAANVGGVVGKIDSDTTGTEEILDSIKGDYGNATVSNSYNTGDVQGYTGVGGVVGMMYNGSVAGSYNLGSVSTTRQIAASGGTNIEPLNMGGVVGDTTEQTDAQAVIYDVYNAGQIGDENFTYFARHAGGVVGRLSGYLEKAYNTGDIYNKDTTVGGVVGWWYNGGIKDVFNTGNITVRAGTELQVGGIVGASSAQSGLELSNAYNLGTIRGFQDSGAAIMVGGIIGRVRGGYNTTISNVYALGNIYAATRNADDNYQSTGTGLGAIYGIGAGQNIDGYTPNLSHANYIKPETTGTGNDQFRNLSNSNGNNVKIIEYADRGDADKYDLTKLEKLDGDDWSVNDGDWRIYANGTPILNAFTPNMAASDGWKDTEGITGVQYGTAYNPLLTILNVSDNVSFNWGGLGLTSAGGLAVYGGGLTLDGFTSGGAGRYFGGTLYSDGALNVSGTSGGFFNLGSAARLYGSSVTLDSQGGDITLYGSVTSTNGGITINGGGVEILGSLTASKIGKDTTVNGIAAGAEIKHDDTSGLSTPDNAMTSVSDMHSLTVKGDKDGDITVSAQGGAEILYGNLGTGSVSAGGNLSVTSANGAVYADSDVSGVNGNISLEAGGEALLDITNVAKANAGEDDPNGTNALHTFLDNYSGENGKTITLKSANDDVIIAIDMWEDSEGAFGLGKYDITGGAKLTDALSDLNLGGLKAEEAVRIWVGDAEQLKGIQTYAESNKDSKILGYNFALRDNIDASALTGFTSIGKDAANGFSGVFDGRGFRVIGLTAEGENAGIFDTLTGTVHDLRVYSSTFSGTDNAGAIAGVNKGEITGVTTFGNHVEAAGAAGGIAGVNSGTIAASNASDSVIANGANASAGGVAGINNEKGEIGADGSQVTADSAVTSGANGAAALGGVAGDNKGSVLLANSLGVTNGAGADNIGGIAGVNSGEMKSLYNESIVTGKTDTGGVAGTNSGTITNAVNATNVTGTEENTGGLVGKNSGTVDSGRNAGVVTGVKNVGGMVGHNADKGAALKNLSNAINASINGQTNVGGIAGTNDGTINNENALVNEGTVTGTTNVGGIAGMNNGTIQNVDNQTLVLETDGAGGQYFGGIAGVNNGTITDATNTSSVTASGAAFVGGIAGQNGEDGLLLGELTNEGSVTGKGSVGGLVGSNSNDELLKGTAGKRITVTNKGTVTATEGSAGGIFYENTGNIEYADLTNTGTVIGKQQSNTGGLFGINRGNITNSTLANSGTVEGGKNTGGLIGSNSGNVSSSTLINTADAVVNGGDNTGGLIGCNTGEIAGGRNENDTMYADRIVNNGNVKGGDSTGGLIGYNAEDGSLYAAYNTGGVKGDNNVGGVVGTNAGTVSSVFNTIMTKDGQGEEVAGASNAGGIVGNNSGTLTDAYNTTAVAANGTKGSAVGENSGTIKNVYATNTDGKLIGQTTDGGSAQNVYTFAADDGSAAYIGGDAQKQSGSYDGFDFTGTWKNYDGWSMPMLAVFLTKAQYNDNSDLTYNAGEQKADGSFTAADGLTANENTGNQLLLQTAHKDAGQHMAYYSSQIASSTDDDGTFNPNNLGYDIDNNSYTIKKAQLDVILNDIYRTYGDAAMYDKDGNATDYGLSLRTGLNEAMLAELAGGLSMSDVIDGAVHGLANGKTTNNAGTYAWSALVTLAQSLTKNYQLDANGASSMRAGGGSSYVNKAGVTISVNDASTTYGTAFDKNGYGLTFGGLVNGDTADGLLTEIGDVEYTNTAALGGTDGKWTANAGDHENAVGVTGVGELKNYNIVEINNGDAHIEKASLTITADDQNVMPGVKPSYTGTTPERLAAMLVNGDKPGGFSYVFGVADESIEGLPGFYPGAVGLFAGGDFYGGGVYDWSALSPVFANYDVTVVPGSLTVVAPYNHGHLHGNGWSRIINFAERKAEIHFRDGGMLYDSGI
ncbi:filamentous hemagglutinin N-terminal domain-containing protein [Cloacibacillus sp. An23]|uniref:filamentous hemagglutinin N-terminal domain-containing protein n=1 Tax=Cloacibacillus sp. An23 TaxID=1965591 RepID=UPI001302B70A|nr:filamentous hemagglutinin N-terminal domain-containing protein [Cloacibacillus sp. An23]